MPEELLPNDSRSSDSEAANNLSRQVAGGPDAHDVCHMLNYDRLYQILRQFFLEMRLTDASSIKCPSTRAVFQGFLDHVLQHGSQDRFDYSASAGNRGPKLRQLKPKRRDQYIKKAHSKLKTIVFAERKKVKTPKSKTLQKIRKDFDFGKGKRLESKAPQCITDEDCFENLFGSRVQKGLLDPTIDHILLHKPKLFRELFNQRMMKKRLIEALRMQTEHDIKANLIVRVQVELGSGADAKLSDCKRVFSNEAKHFKKPFTQFENILSVYFFIGCFVRRCRVLSTSQRINMKNKSDKLRALQARLLKSASDLVSWEVKPPFNNQAVESFVMMY
jgi:hypothetical protein